MSWLSDEAIERLRVAARWPAFPSERYTVTGEIGRGGMGTVYAALDETLGREVAIKVLNTVQGPSSERRRSAESRVLALLEGFAPGGAGAMRLYTYSAARQRLAEVLEQASREGEAQIRRQDGRIYAVTPVVASVQSPFASVTGGPVSRLTSKELLRVAREEGRARGERVLRSARGGRVPRARSRPHK